MYCGGRAEYDGCCLAPRGGCGTSMANPLVFCDIVCIVAGGATIRQNGRGVLGRGSRIGRYLSTSLKYS